MHNDDENFNYFHSARNNSWKTQLTPLIANPLQNENVFVLIYIAFHDLEVIRTWVQYFTSPKKNRIKTLNLFPIYQKETHYYK